MWNSLVFNYWRKVMKYWSVNKNEWESADNTVVKRGWKNDRRLFLVVLLKFSLSPLLLWNYVAKQTTVYILQSSREFVPTQRLMKVGKTKLRTCDFVALKHTFRSPIINALTLMERSWKFLAQTFYTLPVKLLCTSYIGLKLA